MRLAALLAAALLAGCAAAPRVGPGEQPWTSGRLALRIESQPVQTANVAFELRSSDGRDSSGSSGSSGELRLNTPIGTRLATARWAPGMAVLNNGNGEQRFQNLDDLSRTALGEPLPLSALPDWLAGRPWPGAPHQVVAGGFQQLGWQVDLARRADGFVEARRDAPPVVTVRVKLDDPS